MRKLNGIKGMKSPADFDASSRLALIKDESGGIRRASRDEARRFVDAHEVESVINGMAEKTYGELFERVVGYLEATRMGAFHGGRLYISVEDAHRPSWRQWFAGGTNRPPAPPEENWDIPFPRRYRV